jgi:hypothetical protein
MTSPALDHVAAQLRTAFEQHDLVLFGMLLADDVWWGEENEPQRCRGRADVLATFGRLVGQGVDTTVSDIVVGRLGILAIMQARWADGRDARNETALFHAYSIRGSLITGISRYGDPDAALEAIGA